MRPFPNLKCRNAVSKNLFMWICLCSGSVFADGETMSAGSGQLDVNGMLLEAPCLLNMRSQFQDIKIEGTTLSSLKKVGDSGEPVQIHFELTGCQHLKEPLTMKIKFLSPAVTEQPKLFAINGVTGLALRLENSNGQQIFPAESYDPVFKGAANQLIYTVTPVRIPGALKTGNFSAAVDFGMSYE